MSLIAILILSIACFAFVFWPERTLFTQADKTRVDYLRERKEVIYENLRDLNFEHLAGKYSEADYIEQRNAMEEEAARVVSELEALQARGVRGLRSRA